MKLSDAQHRNLQWLADNGGKGYLRGEKVHYSAKPSPPCVGTTGTWLHLVVKGCVEGRDGCLLITDYGRRVLNPLATPAT